MVKSGFCVGIVLSFLLLVLSLSPLSAFSETVPDLTIFNGKSGTLRISGGTAHIPVMKAVATLIMRKFPEIRISVAGGGSGVGIKQVGEGLVDIGNSGRKPSPSEIKKYGLVMHCWAWDGIGVIVHKDNPLSFLTRSQLQDIFSGRIDNWRDLGGVDRSIVVVTRDQASGTRRVFWKKALRKGGITDKALVVPSNGAMKGVVTHNPYAIGYVSVGFLDDQVAAVPLDGVVPTLTNVRNGSYPIARRLFSNTRGQARGLAADFINFLYSKKGQEIIADKGFISVSE